MILFNFSTNIFIYKYKKLETMEFVINLIGCILFIILSSIISGTLWALFLDVKFGMINKRMRNISIALGILWPIGLPLLLIVAIINTFTNKNKKK